MQTVITYLALLLSAAFLTAQNSIEVELTNFDSDQGHVRVGLYNDADTFLDDTYKSIKSEIKDGKAFVTFTDLPEGTYAISCYHDKDDNGSLNMFMGMIPKEPYGTSNNARGFFGPPKWEDAKFDLGASEKKKLRIAL